MEGCVNVSDNLALSNFEGQWLTDKNLNDNAKLKYATMKKKKNVKMMGDKDLAIYEESKCCTLFYYQRNTNQIILQVQMI